MYNNVKRKLVEYFFMAHTLYALDTQSKALNVKNKFINNAISIMLDIKSEEELLWEKSRTQDAKCLAHM